MGREFKSRTFIPLFPEPWNAASLERLLLSLGAGAGVSTRCVRPPLTGLPFLTATGQIGALIDEWWRVNVPPDSLPVLLMLHDLELPAWIGELEAAFVIGITGPSDLALYRDADPANVAVVQGGPPEVTERAIRLYGGGDGERRPEAEPAPELEPDLLDHDPGPDPAARRSEPEPPAPALDAPSAPRGRPASTWTARPGPAPAPGWGAQPAPIPSRQPDPLPGARDERGGAGPAGGPGPQWEAQRPAGELDPFKALVAARPITAPAPRLGSRTTSPLPPGSARPRHRPAAPAAPPPRGETATSRPSGLRAFLRDVLGLGGRSAIPKELTQLALAQDQGKVVGVISRAGGVGKTATAAALGIIFGEAVQTGWSAAVIDQNTGNPDQWGRLELDEHVPTVSEIMADIEAGQNWTIPTWGRTPGLAVYPENRLAGDAYAPAQIERFASQLRRLHMVSVVDLPNRLPAFTSGEAALCAGWICAADLLVIPTTDDPMRLQGVIDLLDAPLIGGDARSGYRSVPVVVAYLRSPMRAIRQSAAVSGVLDGIRGRVLDVVEIPKDERATLAIVKGKPITEIDPRLRRAYIDLALAIASALAEA